MKPWIRSVGAVVGGFLVTAIASTATDAIMHVAGVFPGSPRSMSASLFGLASGYRALFTVAGGFVTARMAPDRPMRHAWILAWIGLAAGLAGVVAYYVIGGAQLGPAWYPVSIAVESIPCVWFGGRLATRDRSR
ncbi:hypothetical protein AB4Y89_00785 [Terriglobus sp. 2YAB30_2]|uniref:hypothetical protein n=1 Tax=unclassified Terriglobus TaxID=2628988 RepID=UPI003F9575F9